MAVTYPPVYSPVFDAEFDVESPVSEETVRKLIQNCNMLSLLACVGQVGMFQPNIPGCPPLSVIQFQFCDGNEITDTTSPLASSGGVTRNTPDLRGKYIRNAHNSTTNGSIGAATINLSHDHGTHTGSFCFGAGPEGGSDYDSIPFCHTHTINADLNAAEPLNPAYIAYAFFLKIN